MSDASLQPAMPTVPTVSNWNLFKDKAANAAHSAAETGKHAFEVAYKTSSDFLRKVYEFFVNVGLPKIADFFRTGKDFAVDHVKRVIEFLSVHREKALVATVASVVTAAVVFIVYETLYKHPVVQGPQERTVPAQTAPPVNSASVAAASSSSASSSSSSSSSTVAATSSSSAPSSSSSSQTATYRLAPGAATLLSAASSSDRGATDEKEPNTAPVYV